MHPVVAEDIARILNTPLPWERFRGKRALVTGASGLLGYYIVQTLLALDVEVVGIFRNMAKAEARFGPVETRGKLVLVAADISAPLSLDGRFDLIIHAASQASPKYYSVDPVGTLEANVMGTRHLLERARLDRSEWFMFVSSGEVYGQAEIVPTGEADYGWLDPTSLRACYGESKRLGETMCVAWGHQHGVPASIVRPFHTFGPGFDLDDGRVFSDFISDVVNGRDIRILGDGLARRAFCYITDAIVGIFTVLLKGTPGQAFNVGNDLSEVSIGDLAQLLTSLFPDRGLKVVRAERASGDAYMVSPINRNSPSTERLRSLGWAPQVSLPDGLRRTIDYLETLPQRPAGHAN